jgi:hypothetical protein
MNKEFLPYEVAVKLKALGFDEPCFGWYADETHLSIRPQYIQPNDPNNVYNWCLAPTFSQAFRWLLALANKDEHFSNKWTISYNEDYYSLFLGGCNMGVFEEELECLKKLIEIVELKK